MLASTKTSKIVYLKVIKKYFRVINLSAFSFFHHLLQRDSCPLFSLAFICCRHKSKYFQGFVLVYRWLARVKEMNDFFQQRQVAIVRRSEEHTSELKSLMRISYAVFCLTKKHDTPEP